MELPRSSPGRIGPWRGDRARTCAARRQGRGVRPRRRQGREGRVGDRRHLLRGRRDQRREGRRGLRQGARGARAGAGPGQLRRRRQRRQDGRPRQGDQGGQALPDAAVRAGDPDQPHRHLPLHRPFGLRNGRPRPAGGRRARRDHQHRLGGRRGRADRPGGLFGVEGRSAGDGAADRARPDERRGAGQHHPARRVQDADGGDDAAQCAGRARRAGAVPEAPGQARGICASWPASWSRTPI